MPKVEATVISLSSASERRQLVGENLKRLSIPWQFFDAVKGAEMLARPYHQRDARIVFGKPLTDGELGCFSSHLLALEDFLRRGQSDWILVLEDDVVFDTRFPVEEFAAFSSRCGIDFIRLFGRFLKPYVKLGFYFDRQVIRFRTSPHGTQAYMMSQSGALRLVKSVSRFSTVYDIELDRFWVHDLPIYAIFPYPAIESFAPTSIPLLRPQRPMPPMELALRYSTRIHEKINKIVCDARLRSRDRELRRKIPSQFRQVNACELNSSPQAF